jgi:hypothetical protein
MKTFISLSTTVLALAVSGCRVAPPNVSQHAGPASASAAESPLPPAAPFLMTGNNYAMPPEGEGQPMKRDMKMDMKDMPEHKAPPGNTRQHEDHDKTSAKPAATPGTPEHHHDNAPKP